MTAIVRLVSSVFSGGTSKRVLCDQVSMSGKANLNSEPNANHVTPTKIHTNTPENISFNIQGIKFNNDAGTFTWANMLELYRNQYADTAATTAYLNVTYGNSTFGTSNVVTANTAGTTTSNIKVVLSSFSFPISARDSRDGYLPVGSMVLLETD